MGLGTIGYRFRSICWWHMGSIGFRFWIEFLGRMVRLELVYAWQGYLIMVMVTVVDHRLRVRYFHWYRDLHWYRNLNVLFANLFDNFSALFLVTVALHNLVIFLTFLLKRLHTLLLWHIHCCGQTLGGNSGLTLGDDLSAVLDSVLNVAVRVGDYLTLLPRLPLKTIISTVFVIVCTLPSSPSGAS